MSIKIKFFYLSCLITLVILVFFAPWSATIDLTLAHYYYENQAFSQLPLWNFIYIYGTWPAWFFTTGACVGLLLSFQTRFKLWRIPCLYFIMTLLIGSGLIVHATLKDHWGRPRPRQVIEFGGKQVFRPFYQPQLNPSIEPSKSFSCGHCTMGFCFFALALLGRVYSNKKVEILGWGLAFSLGLLLSLARIAQGGHFFSDVLVSGLIMWWTAYLLSYIFFKPLRD